MKDYSVLSDLHTCQWAQLVTAYDKGYEQGYVEGQKHDLEHTENIVKSHEKCKSVLEAEYERGLNDAWACCKRFLNTDDICYEMGYSYNWDDFLAQSPSEVIARLKEYDAKSFDDPDNCKIEVGDVCRYQTCKRIFIITSIHEGFGGEEYFDAIYSNGEAIKNGKLSVIEKINGECVEKLNNMFSALIDICITGKVDD